MRSAPGRPWPAWLLGLGLLAASHPAAATPELARSLGIQPPQEAVEAPAFSLRATGGKTVRLADFRGRFVFLNFFATWCPPCREEMPAMERLHRATRSKGLAVLAVDLQEAPRRVAEFVQELGLTFPVVVDPDGSVSREYAVQSLPVTFLLDGRGQILWRAIGSRAWDGPAARRYFQALLGGGTESTGGRRQSEGHEGGRRQ